MVWMLLTPAVEADYAEIVALANWAYRGTGPTASWNMEAGVLEGQRLTESLIREEYITRPLGQLLTYREAGGVLMGTVWLDPRGDGAWYLGLLTVRPDQQNKHLGRTLLASAEEFARVRGGRRIRMTVLHVRDVLIAWYERRGYSRNGETEPFPYGDERFGRPLRDDLHFVVLEKVIEGDSFLD
jgi:ribosomal protein S18 acetylase RimI-like enzyme